MIRHNIEFLSSELLLKLRLEDLKRQAGRISSYHSLLSEQNPIILVNTLDNPKHTHTHRKIIGRKSFLDVNTLS